MMKFAAVILIGVAVVTGIVFFSRSRPAPSAPPSESGISRGTPPPGEPVPGSRYIEYSPQVFAAGSNSRRVLFFYAPWCPTCRPADAEFTRRSGDIPEDVLVFRTSYDNETQLKQKYGVTYQHTFVQVDASGNPLTKWNGGSFDLLLTNLK